MKKILVLCLLVMFAYCGFAQARVKYDSTGRNMIENDTIRGRRQAQQEMQTSRKARAAAAAKINYEEQANKPRSNFYQDRVKQRY